jgi:hypothetical protein
MSVVLVVEPDGTQADLLRKVLPKRIGADLVVVKSTKAALEAIDGAVPDLILLSTLLSPRDEDRLFAHLRSLVDASHLQTLTIPLLRAHAQAGKRKGSFGFRKKKDAPAPTGCDPVVFAEEIVAHLARAAEIRSRPRGETAVSQAVLAPVAVPESVYAPYVYEQDVYTPDPEPVPVVEPLYVPEPEPAWTFEPEAVALAAPPELPLIEVFDEPTVYTPVEIVIEPPALEMAIEPEPEPVIEPAFTFVEVTPVERTLPVLVTPVVARDPIEDELDRLARELGVSLDSGMLEIDADDVSPRMLQSVADDADERLAAEVALVQAEAETRLAVELQQVRADADQRRVDELARLRLEADAVREAAIADARSAAEDEARKTLATELARVRSESEEVFAANLARVRSESEEAFAANLARVQAEASRARAIVDQLAQHRVKAEEAATAELARVRAEAGADLKSELDRIRREAEHARLADQSQAKQVTEQIRETAAREARAIAEAAAHRTLEAELARVRSQADSFLEGELARTRAEAQERQAAELGELRAQMAEMREAAEQARTAAARVITFPVTQPVAAVPVAQPVAVFVTQPVAISAPQDEIETDETEDLATWVEEEPVSEAEPSEGRRDYYSLWQSKPAPIEEPEEAPDENEPEATVGPYRYKHWIKWALPVAASVLLIIGSGSDTVARFLTSSAEKPAPAKSFITEVPEKVFAVAEQKLGLLKVESIGAEVVIDGRSYGQTPIAIDDLRPGTHRLQLRSKAGTITRRITIRAGETTVVSEAIFSGWIAIFSPIPVDTLLNGKPAAVTDDGRIMVAPGTHEVEFVSARFNYRSKETLTVGPGQVTPHTLSIPLATLRIVAPDGAEIRVDGEVVGHMPAVADLRVPIGTHEVSATVPELGDRRATVDVRFDEAAQATLSF